MYQLKLADTPNRKVIDKKGNITIFEYDHDMSVDPGNAMHYYFASKMNVRKRQVLFELNDNAVIIQAGAMQWMAGNVDVATNVKGVGDFAKKLLSSKVTNETAVKPCYKGNGLLMLEPTYKYLLIEDVGSWNGMVIDDGLFLACDANVDVKTVARTNLSSAIAGGEGLFNSCLVGNGYAVLESKVPREELIEIELNNDVMKIDGSFAIAWSQSLEFTVERTTKTLIGSAASGEGLVNVYRGTGKILMAPL
ncbi:MAG: AIM24 family protein [Roseburia sp.]|nr:AIM24 family protein [Roseburia sp.]